MRISKKILACVLAALMAISMMPFTVLADEEVPEGATYSWTNTAGAITYYYESFATSFTSFGNNGTWKLYTDIAVTKKIALNNLASNVTLDLNGHNITSTATDCVFKNGASGGSATSHKVFNVVNTSSTTSTITGVADSGIGITVKYFDFTLGENIVFNNSKTGVTISGSKSNSCPGATVIINGTINAASEFGLTVNGTIQTADPAPKVIVNGAINGYTAGIYAAGNADYTINGTVTGHTGIYQKGGNLVVNEGAVVTGTGDKGAYVEYNDGMYSTGDAIVVEDNESYALGTTTINGGTITSTAAGTSAVAEYDASSAASSAAEQDITVSGGTFVAAGAKDDISEYLIEGATQDANGVVSQTYVAKVGSTYYATLEAAIAAANAGETVTLIGNVVTATPIVVAAGKDIKLDLNGHSISGNIADSDGKKLIQVSGTLEFVGNNGGCIYNTNTAGQGHAACQALTGGKITVNSPIHFGDSDTDMTNANNTNRGCGIQNNGGTLIINDGYYTAIDANYTTGAWAYAILNCAGETTVNNATVYGNNLHGALGCEEGTLTVNGGNFTVAGANNYYSLYADGGVINVNGGTFNNNSKNGVNYVGTSSAINIAGGSFTYSATTPFLQKNSKANPVVTGGTFSTDVTAYCAADYACQEDSGVYVVSTKGVAKVGSTYYATLEEAVEASNEGDTVTLLADVDLTAYPAKGMHRIDITGLTIDLDGHKITASGRWGVLFEGTNATIKNGTMEAIDNSDATGYQYGVYVWGRDGSDEMPDPAQKAKVTLENLTINYGIHTYNAEVTVKNCDVTGSSVYYAIWADCESTVNVESGNFTTGGAAVVGTAQYQNTLFGHININDGNFVVPAGKKLVQTGSSCEPKNTVISGGYYHNANGSVYTVPEINVATNYTQDMTSGEVIPAAVDTMSITVEDDIDLNIYLDDSAAVEDYYKIDRVVYSYNSTPDIEEEHRVTVETPAKRNKDGKVVLSIELAPAQIRDDITVEAYSEGNTQVRNFTTSIADYCNTIIEGQFPENLKNLAKSTLDYGKGASNYFGYNTAEYSGYTIQLSDPTEEIAAVAATAAANKLDTPFIVTGVSYRATSKPEIRFYIDPTSVSEDQLSALNPYVESSIGKAYFAKQDDKFMLVIKNLDIVDFGKQFVVTIKDSFDSTYDRDIIEFTPITWVNAAIKSSDNNLKGLAKTIGNYYLKSVAYFGA